MAKHFLFIVLFCFLASPAFAQEKIKTVVTDPTEARLLLGRHLFTEWQLANSGFTSDYEWFGEARIGPDFSIQAEHSCYQRKPRNNRYGEGGYVKLEGKVIKIEQNQFIMNGKFEFFYDRYLFDNDGSHEEKCTKDGNFIFSRKGHPQYWRLQNAGKLCKTNHYYSVDIFTAPLGNEAPHKGCVRQPEDVFTLPAP